MSATTPAARTIDDQFAWTLRDALSGFMGVDRTIVGITRRPAPYPSTFRLYEVDVVFADGLNLPLMVKDLGSPLPASRGVKPTFLGHPAREIDVYRFVLDATHLGTPVYYGTPSSGERPWLVIERVPATRLRELGDFALWMLAARWLAELHSAYALVPATGRSTRLITYDRDYFAIWIDRAIAISAGRSEGGRALVKLAERHTEVAMMLAALPPTLVHGEFYPSNILIRETTDGPVVCVVDWEMAGRGPGVLDLAALVAGWPAAQALELTAAYYAAHDGTSRAVGFDDFQRALDCAQLQLSLQWLGWSADWSPPSEHVHDWLNSALTLAARLRLL